MAKIVVSKCCDKPFIVYYEEHDLGICSKCNEYVEKADKMVDIPLDIKKVLERKDHKRPQTEEKLLSFDDERAE